MEEDKFQLLDDFASQANDELGRYRVEVILVPDKLTRNDYVLPKLEWKSIVYGKEDELNQVPDDKRGIYAFTISWLGDVLPPHGYVLYVGIAGRDSWRSLRARYKDYLNPKKVCKERQRLAYAFGNWRRVTRFYFAAIDDAVTTDQLKMLEEQINTALLPRYSTGDVEAETKKMRRAFQ